MSQTFQYDPLDVLNRAEKSADEWWSNTLKSAKARTDLDQQHFENAFKNDKQFMTHESDLFKTNNENVYKGTKASYDTLLEPERYDAQKSVYTRDGLKALDQSAQLRNAMSPENWAARTKVYDNTFQSPAAMLEANAATAGIMDQTERNRIAGEVAQGYGGALSAQGVYGQNQRQASSLNIGNMIMSGSWDQANEHLTKSGVNMQLASGDKPGTVVVVTPDGKRSAPMDPSNAAKIFNDMTGVRAGQSQVYTDQVSGLRDKQDHETLLNNAKLAERNSHVQQQMQSQEGRRLNSAYQAAVKEGDKAKIQEAWKDVQAFQQRAGSTFDQSGGVYRPGVGQFDMQGLMRSDEGMKLNREYQMAAAAGDKAKTAQAFAALTDFKRKALVEHNIQNGVDSSPYVSDTDLIMSGGKPNAAGTASVPPAKSGGVVDTVAGWFKGDASAAPAPVYSPNHGAAQAPAPAASTYVPPSSQVKSVWKSDQPMNDQVMQDLEQSRTKAVDTFYEVRRDWERANSPRYRASVSDTQRANIKRELDAARATFDRINDEYATGKREWLRIKGQEAYSPYASVAEKRDEMTSQRMERYGN